MRKWNSTNGLWLFRHILQAKGRGETRPDVLASFATLNPKSNPSPWPSLLDFREEREFRRWYPRALSSCAPGLGPECRCGRLAISPTRPGESPAPAR